MTIHHDKSGNTPPSGPEPEPPPTRVPSTGGSGKPKKEMHPDDEPQAPER